MSQINTGYFKTPNAVFSLDLPLVCIGMYCYFLSCGEDFNPSIPIICKVLGINKNTCYKYLNILIQCNLIRVVSSGHRKLDGKPSVSAVYSLVGPKLWTKHIKTKNVGVSDKTP